MTLSLLGHRNPTLDRDKDGYKEYKITWLVETTDVADGPWSILACPGIPPVGSAWSIGNDSDPWVFAWPDTQVASLTTDEPGYYWTVTQMFTNRPLSRCQTTAIENPLAEPPNISGSYVKYKTAGMVDIFGDPLISSSREMFTGSAVEIDDGRPTVNISMNFVDSTIIGVATGLLHNGVYGRKSVNDATLFGLPAKCVKFSDFSYTRKLYGTCTYYFNCSFSFEINFATWTRRIVDTGTRVLLTGGDKDDDEDFVVKKDKNDEKKGRIFLDGLGNALPKGDPPYEWEKELYVPDNLLLLGIPSSF